MSIGGLLINNCPTTESSIPYRELSRLFESTTETPCSRRGQSAKVIDRDPAIEAMTELWLEHSTVFFLTCTTINYLELQYIEWLEGPGRFVRNLLVCIEYISEISLQKDTIFKLSGWNGFSAWIPRVVQPLRSVGGTNSSKMIIILHTM